VERDVAVEAFYIWAAVAAVKRKSGREEKSQRTTSRKRNRTAAAAMTNFLYCSSLHFVVTFFKKIAQKAKLLLS
jgi:hypothetical protein